MSFGGSVSAMVQMIKENRNLLKGKKRNKFRGNNRKTIYSKEKGESLKFKEVSNSELDRIKEKNRKRIRKEEVKLIKIASTAAILLIILLIYYLK